jgi:hypothetical protein
VHEKLLKIPAGGPFQNLVKIAREKNLLVFFQERLTENFKDSGTISTTVIFSPISGVSLLLL